MATALTTVATARQESMSDWSDMQDFGAPTTGLTNSEGNDPRLRGALTGVCFEALSDRDALEQVHYFSEGRRLLFGV